MSRSIVLLLAFNLVGCTKPDDTDPSDTDVDTDSDSDTDSDTLPTNDLDGDGFDAPEDCDDDDETVYPGAAEVENDGIDQDCDGRDAGATLLPDDLVPGDLVITEIMVDPLAVADAVGEWFEITNTSANPIDLVGLQISARDAGPYVVPGSLVLDPGDLAVVGVEADIGVNGGVSVDIVWADLPLDGVDVLRVGNTAGDLDVVGWDMAFPLFEGRTLSLAPDAVGVFDNDVATAWCAGVSVYGEGDRGTPGAANDACAADVDGDGWDVIDDCDDTDAAAYPGATEVWDDGVDQDCDGRDSRAADVDADDYDKDVDCDDADPTVHPDAAEVADDGVDQDCNGKDLITGRLYIDDLVAGDLLVTEALVNPFAAADATGEWFEVANLSGADADLEGLVVTDLGTDTFTLEEEVVVPADGVVVFAISGDTTANGGVTADVVYAGLALGNDADELVLSNAAGPITTLAWDADWPVDSGASLSLAPGYEVDAADPGVWCASRTVWMGSAGDLGTPGDDNDTCLQLIDLDGDLAMADVDCDDGDPRIYPGAEDLPEDGIDQDCSGADAEWPDADADGYKSNVDCDETDATVYPGATEVPEDGVDQDCDGVDAEWPDADGDGYKSTVDCDDADKTVNPGATEVFADGVDQNCDDLDADYGAADLGAGDLVVTEVMQNPKAVSDANGEWFEVYNASGYDLDLVGLKLTDLGTDSTSVKSTLTVKKGGWLVFGVSSNTTTNGGVAVDYAYGTAYALGNSDDEVILSYGTTTFDEIDYDGGTKWPDPDGYSTSLDPDLVDATENDAGSAWCAATTKRSSGDYGTPGATNDQCYKDADGDGYKEDVDCNDADKTIYPGATDIPGDKIDQDCDGKDAPYPDADGDGYTSDVDCNDADKTIYPGATDKPGDKIDQDCDGKDADFPDADADGYKSDVDCNDSDATINPGATDIPADGIDQDCSGADAAYGDSDGDGYNTTVDCDDSNADVNPGETEVDGDGVDQDCDGYDAAFNVDDLSAGDLVVTEVHADPAKVTDALGQWFELYNPGTDAIDLKGMAFEDSDGNTFSVDDSLVIDAGGYLVFGLSSDKTKNGGAVVDFVYTGVTLDNSGTAYLFDVTNSDGTVTLDSVGWETGWPFSSGVAMGVDPTLLDATLNDDVDSWCAASSTFGDGDYGTPGTANDSCTKTLTVADLVAGDLVINEIMADAALTGTDTAHEWFEVRNATKYTVDLEGLTVHDNVSTASFKVSGTLEVASGGFVVFASKKDSTANGGNTEVDYEYGASSVVFGNSGDSLYLKYVPTSGTTVTIDSVVWSKTSTAWTFLAAGYSLNLDPDYSDTTNNDKDTSWCKAKTAYGSSSNYGTPGSKNDDC